MDTPAVAPSISASRQKNCNSCVQGKRRCDRRTPVCSRCAAKQIPCTYSKTTKIASQPDATPCPEALSFSFGSPADSLFTPNLSFDMTCLDNLDFAATPAPQSVMNRDAPDGGDIPMGSFNFNNLMGINSPPSPSPDQWLIPTANHEVAASTESERPSTPADEEIARTYAKMSSFCDHIEPWHLYDPKTPLHYITNRVKGFTKDMARRNATPFLHRYLYREHTPQCILSCFATSVLYANRTKENTAMVMRALHGAVRELIDGEAGRIVAITAVERLARAQALFLYQITRLFDGDVTLRAQAEKDMPLLLTWLGELCKIRENLGDLAQLEDGGDGVRKQPPKEWERWIFAESVRRTIVIAHSVITLYDLMRDPQSQACPGVWAYVHRWTLARSLWEANSSFEFQRMWRESPQFIISNYSFEKFLEHGRAEDVDEFAEILLSVYLGVDEPREFFSARASQNLATC
ncbi:hypothetical protein QBC46DRAFT_274519 [Diplogelasinospora grovesii]|uniref:Zn(2)-C6 fungal-type domain-containing protein n=1 Tax=Diplogelasinospora grovesii TaxID=303347 RepID=A0AAN6MY84_9PEZI|nr:hypothetical protein QBC46DRAFT_274519 [Diplogelasinospora grovesii]